MNWQSQIIELLTASLIRPVVLAAAAWLILRIYKVRHPASRHAVWTAVLIGMMMLPIVSFVAPQWKLPLLSEKPETATHTQVQQSDDFIDAGSSGVRLALPATAPSHAAKFAWPAPQTLIVWVYFAGVLAMAIFRLMGWALLLRIMSKSRLLRTRLLESNEVTTPVTVGVLRPSVILPAGWRAWSVSTKRAVLAHEFAHIRRRDTLTSSLTRLAKCVYWFHPLAWWVSRQVSELAELSCDAAALEKNGDPGGYSRILLGFAETVHAAGYRAAVPGLAIASRSGMGHRIDQVFELAGGNLRRLSRPGTVLAFMGVPVMCIAAVVGLTAPASRVFHQAASGISPSQPVVVAQLQQPATPPSRSSQPAPASRPKFDVVSVKHSADCAEGGGRGAGGGGLHASPGWLEMECRTVLSLIHMSYDNFANGKWQPRNIPIEGGPAWIKSDLYTIEAKTEGTPNEEMMRGPMMQALLEDRFRLKIRRETKEVPVYDLIVAKGGPRLQPFKEGSCTPFPNSQFPPMSLAEMNAQHERGVRYCRYEINGIAGRNATVDMQATSLDQFAAVFRDMDRPVVNKTGIVGLFDFRLVYTPDESTPRLLSLIDDADAGPPAGAPSDPTTSPSIFTALQKQLGLKLEPARGSSEYLVVNSVERPSEN